MPELKAKAGSSRSVRGCIAYLTRNGRDIASDYINCSKIDEEERPVWKQMDEVRFLAGNDRMDENHGCAAPRTFEHFIISPDPRDCVDLNTLQALCKAWVEKYFGEYQAAIYYHDDNQGRIPHAHIVVSNTNIRTRGRITTLLTKGYCRRMNDGMGEYVATETIKLMLKKGIQVLNSEILILGFTFKENCPDCRNTKVVDIYNALKEYNVNITVYDPWANPAVAKREYGIDITNELPNKKFDAAIAAVAHKEFEDLDVPALLKEKHVIFDVKCTLDRSIVDGRL